jgi:transcription antitermination factor NusG
LHSDSVVSTAEKTRDGAERWFALRVKSRCEKVVAATVRNKGFEEFLPVYRSRRHWSDRLKSAELPLFAGYVFCRLDPMHRLPLLKIPGVVHFVSTGKAPIPIEDKEIAAIQTAVRSGALTEPWPFPAVGQYVRIEDGPLVGLEGILAGTSKGKCLIVTVTILERSVSVAIDRRRAVPLGVPGRPMVSPTDQISGRNSS